MSQIFLLPLIFFFGSCVQAKTFEPLYYGAQSSEVLFEFDHWVLTKVGAEKDPRMALRAAEEQTTYLFGALSNNVLAGSPKADGSIQVLSVQREGDLVRVNYHYKGTVVLALQVGSEHSFYLPRSPLAAYQAGIVTRNGGFRFYPCTDADHSGYEYFWYFFNPKAYGCPLIEGTHYDRVVARVLRLPNTRSSTPHYQALAQNGLRVDILVGMDNPWESRNPFVSKDFSATIFKLIHRDLLRLGYEAHNWTISQMRQVSPSAEEGELFVESLIKTTARGQVEVRIFFGSTGFEGGEIFHHFLKSGLEEASIMIYNGHSGLGAYLDLESIEEARRFHVNFQPELEQLYFFNGCSSYPYYNAEYFDRKGGPDHLDILTNGLATLFSSIHPSTMALVKALDLYMENGQETTYQEIIKRGDSQNLLGVNGDEPSSGR